MKVRVHPINLPLLEAGKLYGRNLFHEFKKKRENPFSQKNNWGISSPEEKKWVAQHMAESPEERIQQLEKQVKALMYTRKLKIQAEQKIGKQKAHLRDLQQKFDVAQTRIHQLEMDSDRYKLERDQYAHQALKRFNRSEKESGLPTLSPGQLAGSDSQATARGTESPGQPAEQSALRKELSREPVS